MKRFLLASALCATLAFAFAPIALAQFGDVDSGAAVQGQEPVETGPIDTPLGGPLPTEAVPTDPCANAADYSTCNNGVTYSANGTAVAPAGTLLSNGTYTTGASGLTSGLSGGISSGGGTALLNPLGANATIPAFVSNVLGIITTTIGPVIVILMLVFTGFLFVTAQGSSDKLVRAREALVWTIVGALILLGAQAIALAISATVQGLSTGTTSSLTSGSLLGSPLTTSGSILPANYSTAPSTYSTVPTTSAVPGVSNTTGANSFSGSTVTSGSTDTSGGSAGATDNSQSYNATGAAAY